VQLVLPRVLLLLPIVTSADAIGCLMVDQQQTPVPGHVIRACWMNPCRSPNALYHEIILRKPAQDIQHGHHQCARPSMQLKKSN